MYVAESTRANGAKIFNTGMTTRGPYVRWGEHIRNVQQRNRSSWVGKGTYFETIGAVSSRNAWKAERTVKKYEALPETIFWSAKLRPSSALNKAKSMDANITTKN